MASKFAISVLNKVKTLPTFRIKDVGPLFPTMQLSVLKEFILELVEDKKVFKYGVKKGTFYSVNPELGGEPSGLEIPEVIIKDVEAFSKMSLNFTSSELFAQFPEHQEYLLRKALVFLRDEKESLFLHGFGKGSVWSRFQELPSLKGPEDPSKSIDLKDAVLQFAKSNLRWFKRSELDNLYEDLTPTQIRAVLYALMDDGDIQVRGDRRLTEYAYRDVPDVPNEPEEPDEDCYIEHDLEFKAKVLEFVTKHRVVTLPTVVEALSSTKREIHKYLGILVKEGEVHHEGTRKSSRYTHKDVKPSQIEQIIKEQRREKELSKDSAQLVDKSIDELSRLLFSGHVVYITYIESSQKYELRACNTLVTGTSTLAANDTPLETLSALYDMTILREKEAVWG